MTNPNPAGDDRKGERGEELKEELDALLDEIDDVNEESAEEFVKSYAQKGGQGWSSLVDPSFFIGAAAASLAAGITWDVFKTLTGRVVHALRNVPGPSGPDVLLSDGSYDENFEYALNEAWSTAKNLLKTEKPFQHSLDEATALHWLLFFTEMQRAQRFIRLRPDHYERITRAAAATPERLQPSQVVARIIDQWLRENPMTEHGISH
jgi:ubiquitin-like protein Pup